MSGHSKWANIKNKKGKADAARGKIFTKIGREIAIAVRDGGSNPDTNSKLRDVIAKAKANNMPNIYPEFIPAVLVEPEDIASTFWKLQGQSGAQVLIRTVESIRIAFYAGLCRWGALLTLAGLLIAAVKGRREA